MIEYRVPLHDRGPALWPEYITLQKLEETHREVGTPVFQTMYQGEPGGLKGQIIRREFLRYMIDGAIERAFLNESTTYMTVDPAISEKTSADETALCVGSIHPATGTVYVRWIWHGRIPFSAQVKKIADAAAWYKPVTIGIEAVAYQTALVQDTIDRFPDLPIEPWRPRKHEPKDKFSRWLALGALYENARILHHPSLEASAFEHQLVNLPASKHDDMADAAAMLTTYANAPAELTRRPEGFI